MTDMRLPLYQRLRDDMLARIAAGDWAPGTAIPTEAELTKYYGVAVGTLRRAVETLVQDGLMERSQGRGTFIRRPNFDGSLFRFFRHVDSQGERRVPTGRVMVRHEESAGRRVADALGLEEGASVVYLERVRQIDGQTIFHEQIWLDTRRFAPLLTVDPADFGNLLYPFYEQQCGQLIGAAEETLSVATASQAMADRLSIDPGQPVIVIERIAKGYDATPLEFRRSTGDAGPFRYRVDIT
ncbi:GntR family transcriptional regulator [Vreelandella malpeensis]|uniref:GntR family transcriptional regulator n=1 Tax=Vreelandella malpeensis TaxID=1172368 RepID=A0ABS8DSG3_9GAMM|nr:GntR family transcriptional regulator [Halomonas malpeensis]MCB8889189.1 GntR family transcriptional regulator [Halomonas malpeensis]